jgi:hypothetical protein
VSWVWLETEKRFADPAHEPGWTADDRPAWSPTHSAGNPKFVAWIHRLLDELDEHARAEREKELERDWPEFGPNIVRAIKVNGRIMAQMLQRRLDEFRIDNPKLKRPVDALIEEERVRAIRKASDWQGGAGRPASGVDWSSATACAARDLWRIRHVILPRFWPEGAKPGRGLTNARLATIAAARHPDVSAEAALHWYEKQRLAKL